MRHRGRRRCAHDGRRRQRRVRSRLGARAEPATTKAKEGLRQLIAGQSNVVRALREALGRCAIDAEAHRRAIARLRPQLDAAQREVAWLQTGDGQCARTRAYHHWDK